MSSGNTGGSTDDALVAECVSLIFGNKFAEASAFMAGAGADSSSRRVGECASNSGCSSVGMCRVVLLM